MSTTDTLVPILEIQATPIRDVLGTAASLLLGLVLAVFVLDQRPMALKQSGLIGGLIGIALGLALRVAYLLFRPESYSLILTRDHLFGPADDAGERSRVPVHDLPVTPLAPRNPLSAIFRSTVRLTSPSGTTVAFLANRFSRKQLAQLSAAIRAVQSGAA